MEARRLPREDPNRRPDPHPRPEVLSEGDEGRQRAERGRDERRSSWHGQRRGHHDDGEGSDHYEQEEEVRRCRF